MFFTEAKIASRLRHKNIVGIAGFGRVQGIHCLAMEYVFGASLAQLLRASAKAKRPLTVGVILRIAAYICDALHHAHEMRDDQGQVMGVVHRDVTPQNILVGFNGVPKITDFGIAKAVNRGWETQAGIVKGKFAYMSPEQTMAKAVDRRSDIFGLGVVLWEALTGRKLFKAGTPMEMIAAIRGKKIEPPSKAAPSLTAIVDPIVMRALRRSPKSRYQTAADMRDDILDLIERSGVYIDLKTIAKEIRDIYGEDIDVRSNELRKAVGGDLQLESLAKALGARVMSPKQLPMVPDGSDTTDDPDPLGLFLSGKIYPSYQVEANDPAVPARVDVNMTLRQDADKLKQFNAVDELEDLQDLATLDPEPPPNASSDYIDAFGDWTNESRWEATQGVVDDEPMFPSLVDSKSNDDASTIDSPRKRWPTNYKPLPRPDSRNDDDDRLMTVLDDGSSYLVNSEDDTLANRKTFDKNFKMPSKAFSELGSEAESAAKRNARAYKKSDSKPLMGQRAQSIAVNPYAGAGYSRSNNPPLNVTASSARTVGTFNGPTMSAPGQSALKRSQPMSVRTQQAGPISQRKDMQLNTNNTAEQTASLYGPRWLLILVSFILLAVGVSLGYLFGKAF